MGKKSKSQRSERRLAERKALKAARRALYKSYGDQGRKVGSRRARRKVSSALTPSVKHAVSNCGNPGCCKDYPQFERGKVKPLAELRAIAKLSEAERARRVNTPEVKQAVEEITVQVQQEDVLTRAEYRGLLDLPFKQIRTLTDDECKLLISLTLMEKAPVEKVAALEPLLDDDLCYQIITGRLEAHSVPTTLLARAYVSMFCKGIPGVAVQWAYTLSLLTERLGHPVTLTDVVYAFPMGMPTAEAYNERWDAQKRHHAPRGYSDNWLADPSLWVAGAVYANPAGK